MLWNICVSLSLLRAAELGLFILRNIMKETLYKSVSHSRCFKVCENYVHALFLKRYQQFEMAKSTSEYPGFNITSATGSLAKKFEHQIIKRWLCAIRVYGWINASSIKDNKSRGALNSSPTSFTPPPSLFHWTRFLFSLFICFSRPEFLNFYADMEIVIISAFA